MDGYIFSAFVNNDDDAYPIRDYDIEPINWTLSGHRPDSWNSDGQLSSLPEPPMWKYIAKFLSINEIIAEMQYLMKLNGNINWYQAVAAFYGKIEDWNSSKECSDFFNITLQSCDRANDMIKFEDPIIPM